VFFVVNEISRRLKLLTALIRHASHDTFSRKREKDAPASRSFEARQEHDAH
jgi:hypothetical protein